VDLAGFDDEDVAGAAFESPVVDGPDSAAFADELDFVVGMAVRAGAGTGLAVEQEDGNASVGMIRAYEFMRAAYKRQVFLAYVMHRLSPLWLDSMMIVGRTSQPTGERPHQLTRRGYPCQLESAWRLHDATSLARRNCISRGTWYRSSRVRNARCFRRHEGDRSCSHRKTSQSRH